MRSVAALAAAMALSAPGLSRAAPGDRRCGLTLEGRVLDADLGTPLAGAVVLAEGRDAPVRTGADGRFSLDGLCEGPLRLTVSKPGFVAVERDLRLPESSPIELALRFPTQSVTIVAPSVDPLADLGFSDELDGEALASVRGLGLGEALAETSGVTVLRSGAVAKPVVDGFSGSRLLILNDGIRHHAQLWALDHAPEIDPFGAHRLRVIRGAEGVRYGADGIGGVISVEPPPFVAPDAPGVRGEANLVGMTNGLRGLANLGVVGTVPEIPRLGFRVQGSLTKAGALSAPDYVLDNTAAEDLSGAAALRYAGEGWMASLGVSHLAQTYGIFTGIRGESPRDFEEVVGSERPPQVELYGFDYDIDRSFSRVRHTYLRAEVSAELGLGTLRALYGFQDNDRREFETTRVPTDRAQLLFDLESHTLELAWTHAPGPRLSGELGVNGLLQSNDHEGRRLIPDYERWTLGVFAIERLELELASLALGFRYERQGLDTEQPTRVAPNQNPPERFALDFEAVQASLGLGFEPHPAWSLDLRVATAVRIPTIDELFLDGLLPGEIWAARGDRALEPERTFNVGLRSALELEWLELEATAFLHRIADYIYRAPATGPDGAPRFELLITGRHPLLVFRNTEALQAGGTAQVVLRPWAWVRLRSRGSWVRGRDLERDAPLFNIPPDRYENRLIFSLGGLGPLRGVELYGESVFVARRLDFDPAAELAPPPPAYHLVNAGVSGTFPLGPSEVRTSVDIRNLLDTSYRDYLSRLRFFADEPGFDAILRVQVSFDETAGGTKEGTS